MMNEIFPIHVAAARPASQHQQHAIIIIKFVISSFAPPRDTLTALSSKFQSIAFKSQRRMNKYEDKEWAPAASTTLIEHQQWRQLYMIEY